MVKKVMILLMVLFCFKKVVNAQIRHVKGLKAVHAGVAITDLGYGANLGYLMYLRGNYSAVGGITIDRGKQVNNRDAFGMIIDLGAGYSAATIGNNIYLNSYAGGCISYDKVENAEAYQVGNGINYGVFLTPELEYFINDTFSILGKAPIRYLFSNAFGGLRVQASIGLRYNF